MNIRQSVQRAHEHNHDDQITRDEFDGLYHDIEESIGDENGPNTTEDWQALSQAHFVNDSERTFFLSGLQRRFQALISREMNVRIAHASPSSLYPIQEHVINGRGRLTTSESVCAQSRESTGFEVASGIANSLGCFADSVLFWNRNSQYCRSSVPENICTVYQNVSHPTPLSEAVVSLFPSNWTVTVNEEGAHILFPGQAEGDSNIQPVQVSFRSVRESVDLEVNRVAAIRWQGTQRSILAEERRMLRPYNDLITLGVFGGFGNVLEAGLSVQMKSSFHPRLYDFNLPVNRSLDPQNRFNLRHGATLTVGYRFPLVESIRDHFFAAGIAYSLSNVWTTFRTSQDVHVKDLAFSSGANVWSNFGQTTYIEPFLEVLFSEDGNSLSGAFHFGVPVNASTGDPIFYLALRFHLNPIRINHGSE
ncbi:MAG: hypothetical protein IPJ69_13000 [Deltaproteobacteria bacterium]|nr:MAG: hypothetical protein IPJ69_13000 [Deltaproteobacteria bacterium]